MTSTPLAPPPSTPAAAPTSRPASSARAPSLRWRTLITPALSGADNMALDHALLERAAQAGEAVLRVYGWCTPTLSLGRNQTARGRYDRERARALGVGFVRRPTGGRAVLHHHEVTYSITAPETSLGAFPESYRAINRLLIAALRGLGLAVEIAEPVDRAPRPGTTPCFEEPMRGEIVAGTRKLVGSAQLREHGALLQHGSILIDDDQPLASALLLSAARPTSSDPTPPPGRSSGAAHAPAPHAPATLRELMGRAPAVHEIASALVAQLPDAEPLGIDPALERAALRLRAHYEDPAWTWRR